MSEQRVYVSCIHAERYRVRWNRLFPGNSGERAVHRPVSTRESQEIFTFTRAQPNARIYIIFANHFQNGLYVDLCGCEKRFTQSRSQLVNICMDILFADIENFTNQAEPIGVDAG